MVTMVVTVLGACGGSATKPPGQSLPAAFPVTVTRTGGIAGFQDVLVVGADGLVSVTRKGQPERRCRLSAAVLARLTSAVSQVPWAQMTPARTRPSFPDDMVSTVQTPAGGPVRLEDLVAGRGGQVFPELLNSVNNGQASSGVCAPSRGQ